MPTQFPTSARRAQLRSLYGFECGCERCTGAEGAAVDELLEAPSDLEVFLFFFFLLMSRCIYLHCSRRRAIRRFVKI